MQVQYEDQVTKLALVVVVEDGTNLLGQNWLKYLRLNWSEIATVPSLQPGGLDVLLKRHAPFFKNELGRVEPFQATLQVDPDAQPRFFNPMLSHLLRCHWPGTGLFGATRNHREG